MRDFPPFPRPPKHILGFSAMLLVALAMLGGGCNDTTDPTMVEERIKTAEEWLSNHHFQKAYSIYEKLRPSLSPGSSAWNDATFGMAICQWQMSPPGTDTVTTAESLFAQIVHKAPDSVLARVALLNIGRIQEVSDFPGDQENLPAARKTYESVTSRWPETPQAHEAVLRLAGTYIQLYDQPEAIRKGVMMLEDWLAKDPSNPLAPLMLEYLAETYLFYLNEPERSLRAYLELEERYGAIDPGKLFIIHWRMARIADQLADRPEVAADYYQKMITEHPRSGYAWQAHERLEMLRDAHPELNIEVPSLRPFEATLGPEGQPFQTP